MLTIKEEIGRQLVAKGESWKNVTSTDCALHLDTEFFEDSGTWVAHIGSFTVWTATYIYHWGQCYDNGFFVCLPVRPSMMVLEYF